MLRLVQPYEVKSAISHEGNILYLDEEETIWLQVMEFHNDATGAHMCIIEDMGNDYDIFTLNGPASIFTNLLEAMPSEDDRAELCRQLISTYRMADKAGYKRGHREGVQAGRRQIIDPVHELLGINRLAAEIDNALNGQ